VGVTLDGCPPRIPLTRDEIQYDLDRRRPGQSRITTPRNEADSVEIMSGFDRTTASPLARPLQCSSGIKIRDLKIIWRMI
jgi:chorismate synthase